MSNTILFDRELAKEMQRDLSDIMSTYTPNSNGSDYYCCNFCSRFQYVGYDRQNNRGTTKPIEHGPDCLGMRMMKELDKRLDEPAPSEQTGTPAPFPFDHNLPMTSAAIRDALEEGRRERRMAEGLHVPPPAPSPGSTAEPARCPECDGTGWFSPTPSHYHGWPCTYCGGTGLAPKEGKP